MFLSHSCSLLVAGFSSLVVSHPSSHRQTDVDINLMDACGNMSTFSLSGDRLSAECINLDPNSSNFEAPVSSSVGLNTCLGNFNGDLEFMAKYLSPI